MISSEKKETNVSRKPSRSVKIIFSVCLLAITALILSFMVFSLDVSLIDVADGFDVIFYSNHDGSSAYFSDGRLTATTVTTWKKGTCGPQYTVSEGTISFTNSDNVARVISFDYSVEGYGTCSIGSNAVDGPGSYSQIVLPGENLEIAITSYKSKEGNETVSLYNIISTIADVRHTVSFVSSEGGSIAVNGNTITETLSVSATYSEGITVAAVPSPGKTFVGWVNSDNKLLFINAAGTIRPYCDSTIHAVFVDDSAPYYQVGNYLFDSFDQGALAAENGLEKVLILIKSASLTAGEYVVPNGVTFLIPNSNKYVVVRHFPKILYGSHSTPSPFITLTLLDGANIIVNSGGSISVSSELSAVGQNASSWNATPTGKHGRITLAEGSSITLEDNSFLYCYGYINGAGTVIANPGSTVWEAFQIRSWRGGTASTSMPREIFPFSQYYVQNIESKLILYKGASEHVFTAITAGSKEHVANATFIGDDGLFILSDGFISKYYESSTDRLIFEINGNTALSSLTLTDLPVIETLNTSALESLPICNNITIKINSGKTVVGENVSFLPGCEIYVEESATVEVKANKKVFLYDHDSWGPYVCQGLSMVPVGYSTVNGTTTVRTASSLTDVVLDLNGTMLVNGHVYTTGSSEDVEIGANIISSKKTGTIIFNSDDPADLSYTYQATQSGTEMTEVAIPVTSAKLHNADGSYTLTDGAAAGDTFVYCPVCDAWGNETEHQHYFTINYKNYDGTTVGTEQVLYGRMPLGPSELPLKAADSKFEYEFASWYPKLSEVTQDAVYTAEYNAVVPGGATVDEELDFKARSLTLYESISVNYKLAPADLTAAGYSDAYVVVTLNNSGSKIVAAADLDSSGRLVYQFKRLSPEYVNTTLYAVIYATKDGQLYRSPVREYSVATYCYNTLNKYATNANYAVLRTLLVDLLHYGACSQQFVTGGYRTNDLADAALTEAQLAQGTNTVPEMTNLESYTVNTDTPLATWSGRGLRLEDGVNFRLTFHLDTGDRPATSADLNGLCVRVTNAAGNKSWTIRSSAFTLKSSTTNDFIFYFKNFNFSMLSDPFYFTVCNAANEPISDTLCYSVETYVEKQYNKASNPDLLKNLVLAILKVGNSARAYSALLGN